mgnify:CR=1 FL=1
MGLGGRVASATAAEAHEEGSIVSDPYILKRPAAQRSGLSPRQILSLASDKKIRSKRVMDPASRQWTIAVHQVDLDKYIASFRKPRIQVMPEEEFSQPESAGLAEKLSLLVQPLWLTLAGAERYTGLPAALLESLITSGILPAIDVGRRKGGHWRVKRSDLEAINGVRQIPGRKFAAVMEERSVLAAGRFAGILGAAAAD